jgi:ribosomal protein L24E
MCAAVKAPPNSVLRIVYLGTGWTLVLVVTPVVGALPGPGGVFVFAFGAALLLKNSNWTKRAYARFARRHPRYARWADKGLRRSSAPRRRRPD